MSDTTCQLPNVLVVTDNCLSLSHGTGTVLLKHFEAYPAEKLLNVYSFQTGQPIFKKHCRIKPKLLSGIAMKVMMAVGGARTIVWQNELEKVALNRSIKKEIGKKKFIPDIIYAVCFGFRGFIMLSKLVEEYGAEVPVILHFFDYQRSDNTALGDLLKELSPAIKEVWSLTSTMAEETAKQMGCPVDLVRIFHTNLPKTYIKSYRPLTADFQAIMIGNCWNPYLLKDIKQVWQKLGEKIEGLKPIRWYVHPSFIEKIRKSNIQFETAIDYCGFLRGDELYNALNQADIAIIPFNREIIPENDYARFSLPSRITEIASMGLPIFCVAGPGTELEKYTREKGIGTCSLPNNPQQFQNDLLAFMEDQEKRTECGIRARRLAAEEFNLRQYQEWFYKKLSSLSKGKN